MSSLFESIAMSAQRANEWAEIRIPVPSGDLGEVAGFLTATLDYAGAGVELREGTAPPESAVVLWVPHGERHRALDQVRTTVAKLAGAGFPIDPRQVRIGVAAPEAEWRDAWMRHFRAERLSPSVVVVPSWDTFIGEPDDVIIDLDPGRAFGTGGHASTRLCLLEIDRLARPGLFPSSAVSEGTLDVRRFLDLGTGSGILAITAAKLWPTAAGLALDTDPEAVEVATENAIRNGVQGRLSIETGSADSTQECFELVLANIHADVLRSLREPLLHRLAAGGVLVLSGLLAEEAGEIGREYESEGAGVRLLGLQRSTEDSEWAAVRLRRTGGAAGPRSSAPPTLI